MLTNKKNYCSQTLQLLQMQLMCNTHVWQRVSYLWLKHLSSPLSVPPTQESKWKEVSDHVI